jgi:Fic family protein
MIHPFPDGNGRTGRPLFSAASVLAVGNSRHLIGDLRPLRADWESRITARRDSAVHRVADLLLKRPVFNVQLLQRELGISTGNARRYVDRSPKPES